MKRAIRGLKKKRDASAITEARMRISKGIRLSIFSSSEFVIVILCRGLIYQAHLINKKGDWLLFFKVPVPFFIIIHL
jgi:hypothetical protein